jgi:hypothetical protein
MAANQTISGLNPATSVGATDTFADCIANGCNTTTTPSQRATAGQLETFMGGYFLPQANLGPSLSYTSSLLNIANPLTSVTGTSCTAAISGSTCNTITNDDDGSTLLLNNTATACSAATGGVCQVTLSSANPINYLCFINTSQPQTANAPNQGFWEILPASGATILPAPGTATGNPYLQATSAPGTPFYLAPGGRACVENKGSAIFLPTEYYPGVVFANFNGTAAISITGLVGFDQYQLTCTGYIPSTNGDILGAEFYYSNALQIAGYKYSTFWLSSNYSELNITNISNSASGMEISSSLDTEADAEANGGVAGGSLNAQITSTIGLGGGYRAAIQGTEGNWNYSTDGETALVLNGSGPTQNGTTLTGIYLYGIIDASNWSGWCRLSPRTLQ